MIEDDFWAMFRATANAPLVSPPPSQQPVMSFPYQPPPPSTPSVWTRTEDKVFENALVKYPEGMPDRWARIAEEIPGKAPGDVVEHYRALLQDVLDIEAGRIAPPTYCDDDEAHGSDSQSPRHHGSVAAKAKEERKKGVPWTEEEHRRFLDGLEKYGKGDWRSISRNAVVTRTPTQVASHAQKYFIRLSNGGKKEKKRGSIHDITKP